MTGSTPTDSLLYMIDVEHQVPARVASMTAAIRLDSAALGSAVEKLWKLVSDNGTGRGDVTEPEKCPSLDPIFERVSEAVGGLLAKAKDSQEWF